MELYHYGVKGMKWGVRRFQKKDGTLTPAGKKRYRIEDEYDKDIYWKGDQEENYVRLLNRIRGKSINFPNRGKNAVGKNAREAVKYERMKNGELAKEQERLTDVESIARNKEAREKLKWVQRKRLGEKNPFKRAKYDAEIKIAAMDANTAYRNAKNDPEAQKAIEQYKNLGKEITGEIKSRYASAVLRDLGYEDTKKGRDFLIYNKFIDLYSEL